MQRIWRVRFFTILRCASPHLKTACTRCIGVSGSAASSAGIKGPAYRSSSSVSPGVRSLRLSITPGEEAKFAELDAVRTDGSKLKVLEADLIRIAARINQCAEEYRRYAGELNKDLSLSAVKKSGVKTYGLARTRY